MRALDQFRAWVGDYERLVDENARLRTELDKAREALRGYERWEADLLMDQEAWGPMGMRTLPVLSQAMWDHLIELQTARNAALRLTPHEQKGEKA